MLDLSDDGSTSLTLPAVPPATDPPEDGDAPSESGVDTDEVPGESDGALGDELEAELEAEAAEMAPLVELPDRPRSAGDEGSPAVDPAAGTRDATMVRLRGRGQVPAQKVRRVIRYVDPVSVLKLSFFFNVCVFAMFLVAAVLLWSAAIGSGSTDNIESFLVDIGFEDFKLVGTDLFRGFVVFGGGLVIAFTLFAVLLALLFNLISDIVGGIRLTIIEPLLGDAGGSAPQGAEPD